MVAPEFHGTNAIVQELRGGCVGEASGGIWELYVLRAARD